MSSTSFTNDEMGFLDLGLKFAVNNNSEQCLINFSIDFDVLIGRLSPRGQIKIFSRNQCIGAISKLRNRNWFHNLNKTFYRIIKSILHKIKDNDIVITKADKGNCLVILNKIDYINKVESYLILNNFTCLTNNPLPFINQTKQIIKNCKDLFTVYNKKFNLIPSNPMMPRLYSLPKIHKLGVPIRLVVSFCNRPVYFVSFILNTITGLTNFNPSHTVKNSTALILPTELKTCIFLTTIILYL